MNRNYLLILRIFIVGVSLLLAIVYFSENRGIKACNSGLEKQNKNDIDGAIAEYTRAIGINSRDAEAYYNRVLAKSHNSRFAEAELKALRP